MKIVEVLDEGQKAEFLLLPVKLYSNDHNWIRPLDKDINEVFDKSKNKFFRHGQCTRFLLLDDQQKTIGRVAVFINEKTSKKESQPTGGMGFFDCIDSRDAAFMLFDTCKHWLQARGMEAMDGPINFGERDSWWGLIVQGFKPAPYKMNYNPPHYKNFFEEYGFKTYFEQWCFGLDPRRKLLDKFYERHAKISADINYKAEKLLKSNIEKYAEDFRTIYNQSFARHGGGKDLESKQVQRLFKAMKPVIDEKIIWFVYYKNDPVAMWVNLPDINQIFKTLNGKFGWFEKIKFFVQLKRRKAKKFIGLVFGVVPEHQGKGVDSFMIVEGAKVIQAQKLYDEYEMQWIGDFNPKMVSIAESLHTEKTRVLITYRYLFDRQKEFKRHPFL